MRIVILGDAEGWHTRQLVRAGTQLGHEISVVEFRRLVAELATGRSSLRVGALDLMEADRVLVRSIPAGNLEQVVARMDALHRLHAQRVRILNPPSAIESCVDKYLATARLAAAGLPVPQTIVCETTAAALEAFESLGGDVVAKPLFGSEGRGILRLDSRGLAERVLTAIGRLNEIFYLQEFIRHPGYDYRALVLGKSVLAAMRRTAAGDFRANISLGGLAEACQLSPRWERLAIAAAAAVGAEFAGVDLLESTDGREFVIEVNSCPGFQAIARTTSRDLPRAIIEYLSEPMASD